MNNRTSDCEEILVESIKVAPTVTPRTVVLDLDNERNTPRFPGIVTPRSNGYHSPVKRQSTFALFTRRFDSVENSLAKRDSALPDKYTAPNYTFPTQGDPAVNTYNYYRAHDFISPRVTHRWSQKAALPQTNSDKEKQSTGIGVLLLPSQRTEFEDKQNRRQFYIPDSPRQRTRASMNSSVYRNNGFKTLSTAVSHPLVTPAVVVKAAADRKHPGLELSVTGARADIAVHPLLRRSMQRQ